MSLQDRPICRRAVVAGAGIAAAAAAVGCSTSDASEPKKTLPAPAPAAHKAPLLGDGVAAPGQKLTACGDVPVGGGVIVGDTVITQPVKDEYYGFSNICTHSGCKISSILDGKIVCPCHGSEFTLTGGVCRGPAKKPLAESAIVMANETIYKKA